MKDFTLQGSGEGEWQEDLISRFSMSVLLAGSAESDDLLDLMDTLS